MKSKFLTLFSLALILFSCSKSINYSEESKAQTAGRYLYNHNEVIDIYYKNNDLFIKWKDGEIKPVVLDESTFFISDMYSKLRFVVHPESKKRYLSVVSKENEDKVTYDYIKVADTFKTPRMYLKDKEFKKAADGFLALQKKDSINVHFSEGEFNGIGYNMLRNKQYEEAIKIFKMNVELFPESDNVYDSLGEAFLRKGDSLKAYVNYKKAFELNGRNKFAERYMTAFEKNNPIKASESH